MKINLIVTEDVPELLEDIEYFLTNSGYCVACADSGAAFWMAFDTCRPDIVILDIGLPGESGLSIAERVRTKYPEVGIVMLTGRSLSADRLSGRAAGADDYLTKPVQLDELGLVLKNLARRLHLDQRKIWILDVQALSLQSPSGVLVDLTRSEMQFLKMCATENNQQATRQRIVESLGYVWVTYDERRLEAIISRLKKKIMLEFNLTESPIRSLRGEGYGFTEPLRLV